MFNLNKINSKILILKINIYNINKYNFFLCKKIFNFLFIKKNNKIINIINKHKLNITNFIDKKFLIFSTKKFFIKNITNV